MLGIKHAHLIVKFEIIDRAGYFRAFDCIEAFSFGTIFEVIVDSSLANVFTIPAKLNTIPLFVIILFFFIGFLNHGLFSFVLKCRHFQFIFIYTVFPVAFLVKVYLLLDQLPEAWSWGQCPLVFPQIFKLKQMLSFVYLFFLPFFLTVS